MSRLAWWWLRKRHLVVQVNTPDVVRYDPMHGWQPLFSIRFGHRPVYVARFDDRPARIERSE